MQSSNSVFKIFLFLQMLNLRISPNHILIDFARGMWYLSRRYGQSC